MSLLKDIFEECKTEHDIEKIEGISRNRDADSVYNTLMYIKEVGDFQVGDVLIKYDNRYNYDLGDYEWKIEKFSKKNDAPRKYKVVHRDAAGLPYVMKISMKGEYCGDLKCIAGYDLSYTKFEYDPDFIDHQILADEDDNFDPQAVYKEKRDEYFKTRPRKAKQAKVLDGHSGSSVTSVP